MAGYIIVERGIFDHPLFASEKPFSKLEAWMWLISNANYQIGTFRNGNTVHQIPRGSIATRYRSLAREWKWSTNRVLRETQTWQKQNMIETQTEQGYLLITICNYDKYQLREKKRETATERQRNANGTATETAVETAVETRTETKLIHKGINTSIYPADFEAWYSVYPRKAGKQDALRAYNKAAAIVSHDVLIAGARLFAAYCQREGTDIQYIAYPSTWLNEGRWANNYGQQAAKTGVGSSWG